MVTGLEAAGITDVRVLDAMARVPRHLFVPETEVPYAYENRALPIAYGQTISQPWVVAKILEGMALDGTERVLDVGTGSGYQAALLGLLAREVYSVEIEPELERNARGLLARLGFRNIHVHQGNGSIGLAWAAPFDAIACAAAAPAIPSRLTDQLAEGGRLVIPVGSRQIQRLIRVLRQGGELKMLDLGAVHFVPLIGELGWSDEGVRA